MWRDECFILSLDDLNATQHSRRSHIFNTCQIPSMCETTWQSWFWFCSNMLKYSTKALLAWLLSLSRLMQMTSELFILLISSAIDAQCCLNILKDFYPYYHADTIFWHLNLSYVWGLFFCHSAGRFWSPGCGPMATFWLQDSRTVWRRGLTYSLLHW